MSGPSSAVAAARLAVRVACADLSPGARVLVACSGGADSLALAAATAWEAARAGWQAGAIIVDHGLQADSATVATRVREQCLHLGLDPVEVRRVAVVVGGGSGGPEAAARQARYAALEAGAADHGAVAVLLGHTADDQAETALLGLARGSGARSIAGMRPRNGLWRRPILGLRRAQTEAVCSDLGLDPWHDPTNLGRPGDPLRSRVRADVLPLLESVLGPGLTEALARTADLLRDDDDYLSEMAERVRDEVSVTSAGLDAQALATYPVAIRTRVIRAALLHAGAAAGSLRREHLISVDRLVTHWAGQGPVQVPGRLQVRRQYGTLVMERLS